MTTKIEANLNFKKNWIEEAVTNNDLLRLLGEFLSSMFFIFSINIVVALGEDEIPFFKFFYNYNIGTGILIGSMTMLAFVWGRKTSLSANMINLTLNKKNGKLKNNQFWTSLIFQFIGGIFGSLLVYIIAHSLTNDQSLHSMGGAYPKLKGLTLNNVEVTNFFNPWKSIDFVKTYDRKFVYAYAVIQGFINASWIVIGFVLNSIVDSKTNNKTKQFLLRYIILLIGISITTIFYANTTNWIRLFTPTLINVIMGQENSLFVMQTTIVYVLVQTIGVIIIYFELILKDSLLKQKKEGEENGI